MKNKLLVALLVLSALLGLVPGTSAGELTVRVTDVETGQPIWGANVRVIEADTVLETQRTGILELRKVPHGMYRVVVTHVAYDTSDTLTVVADGQTINGVKLTPRPWVLDDVVVTGTRSPHLLKNVPVQTEVISQRDFLRTGATTVDEALSSAIGISINDDLSGKGATIRGVLGDRILVLVDGERAVGRVNGSIDLGQFSLSNVDKIEVVKGTGSTLYGSDAMGGVVNIITKKPSIDTRKLSVRSEYGSHGTFNPDVQAEFSKDRLGLLLGARYYRTDGFDLVDSTPHTNGQDQISRLNLDSKLRYTLSDKWNATASTRFMIEEKDWIESEIWPGNLLFVYDDDESNRRYDGSLTFDYMSGDKYSMNLRLYGTYYDHQWNKVERTSGIWLDTSMTEDLFLEASYTSNYIIGQGHMITYGLDYNYQDLKSTELSSTKEADKAGSAYLQYEHSPHPRWTIVPGVRYENHTSFGGKMNPSINIMFRPTDQIKLRGFTGYGFRAPSIKQQYFTFDHIAAGYIVYGGRVDLPDGLVPADGTEFSELKDETSLNASISAELSYGSMGLHRITYFYNHLDDLIEFELVGSNAEYWRGIYVYQNVDRALTQGIEWESRVRLSKNVDFSFSYNYLYNLILDTDAWILGPTTLADGTVIPDGDSALVETGQKLTNRPAHTFDFYLSAFSDRLGMGASFWSTHQSRKLFRPRSNTGGQENTAEQWASSRTTLNLNVFKHLGRGTQAYVRLENLLDQVEPEFGYWPGLTVYAGAKYEFGKE
ncbi:MAG: TonB-dependent receptor [candidate division Zixibacteria bacterium]|nr:TonB-dependent receptor [candidate division Zixibacteria bacterium]